LSIKNSFKRDFYAVNTANIEYFEPLEEVQMTDNAINKRTPSVI